MDLLIFTNLSTYKMSLHPYLDVPGVAISAHRGGSIETPRILLSPLNIPLSLDPHT